MIDRKKGERCLAPRYSPLGDELTVPFREQEDIAVAYLKTHRDELRQLSQARGADIFILGLQYRTMFERNVIGFSLGPSAQLMWHCLDVGCEPMYYINLDRFPELETEDAEQSGKPELPFTPI